MKNGKLQTVSAETKTSPKKGEGIIKVARRDGVEPATASFEDSCSIQLSYRRATNCILSPFWDGGRKRCPFLLGRKS